MKSVLGFTIEKEIKSVTGNKLYHLHYSGTEDENPMSDHVAVHIYLQPEGYDGESIFFPKDVRHHLKMLKYVEVGTEYREHILQSNDTLL